MQFSAICLVLFLSSSIAIDITKPHTLIFQNEELCSHHGGTEGSIISTQMSGSVLKINPYNWNDNQTMTCSPISYSREVIDSDPFGIVLGEKLMPLTKSKNQIVLYNCSYEDGTSEPVFLVNANQSLMLNFVQGDCQITFGIANNFDFSSLDLRGIAQNPNACTKAQVSGEVRLNHFGEVSEDGNGSVDMFFQEIEGTTLTTNGKDITFSCLFTGTGVYSTIVCSDQMFASGFGMFEFFYLDDGRMYFYQVDTNKVDEECWQYAFGKLGLVSFGLLVLLIISSFW